MRHAEALHVFQSLRERRRTRRRGKSDEKGLAHEMDETPQRHTKRDERPAEHREQEKQLRTPRRREKAGQAGQHVHPSRRHRASHCGEHRRRRQIHNEVRKTKRDRHHGIRQFEHRPRLLPDRQTRDAEEKTKDDNLQHVAPRHRIHDARGKRIHEHIHERHRWRAHRRLGHQRDAIPGAHDHRRKPAEQQRQRRRHLEVEERLPSEPAQILHATHAADRAHQHPEKHGRNDCANEPQKNIADKLQVRREAGRGQPERDSAHGRDQHPLRERDPAQRAPRALPQAKSVGTMSRRGHREG